MKLLFACFALPLTALPLLSSDTVFKSSDHPSSLIELYSSEGCSSCPPAEAWLNELKKAPGLWTDTFPVGFHVDYWDNLGWPDRFASAAFTRRQQDYASRLGQDSLYTPEFIVNGKEWRLNSPIKASAKSGQLILTVNERESSISADYTPTSIAAEKTLHLNVALLGFNLISHIKDGENSGRTLIHDFVVLGFGSSPLAVKSDGSYGAPIAVKTTSDDTPGAIIAWVSAEDGTVLQIAGGWIAKAP